MNLRTYLSNGERGVAARVARHLRVSPSYLSQMAAGTSPISPRRCVSIEQVTRGLVRRQDLRPHDWPYIWPELQDTVLPLSNSSAKGTTVGALNGRQFRRPKFLRQLHARSRLVSRRGMRCKSNRASELSSSPPSCGLVRMGRTSSATRLCR